MRALLIIKQHVNGLLAAALFCASPPGAFAASAPPANAIGDYFGLACPKHDLACVPTKASDRLTITRAADGHLRIKLKVAFEGGQRCQLETDVTFSEGSPKALADIGESTPCELVLHQDNRLIVVEDISHRCRNVYCGTRGTFDGLRFRRR